MKTRLYFFLTIFFLSFCIKATVAQTDTTFGRQGKITSGKYPNTIKLSFGDYYIRNTQHYRNPFAQIGVAYERKVYKRLFANISYTQWNMLWKGQQMPKSYYARLSEENTPEVSLWNYHPKIGAVSYRRDYQMIDISGFYKLQIKNSSHFISVGVGASYNWGVNTYLQSYSEIGDNNPMTYYDAPVTYWGGISSLSYEYRFLKDRFSAGFSYKCRYYPNRIKLQHEYLFSLGVNF